MSEISIDGKKERISGQNTIYLLFITFLILFFIIGYLLRKNFEPPTFSQSTIQTATESPQRLLYEKSDPTSVFFQKEYFNDTYIVVEKNSPYKSVLLSIDRIEKSIGFNEKIEAHYFNGENWENASLSTSTTNNDIDFNTVLQDLKSSFENDGSMSAQITVKASNIAFSSRELHDEVRIKSNGEEGQFIYQGEGLLLTDDMMSPAYIFHERKFSFDAAKISYLINPQQTTRGNIVFWDEEGSFYFFEKIVPSSTSHMSQDYLQGIKIDNRNQVSRTDSLKQSLSQTSTMQIQKILFGDGINDQLQIPFTISQNISDVSTQIMAGSGKVIKSEGRAIKGTGVSLFR